MKDLLIEILGEGYGNLTKFYAEGRWWFKAQDICKVLGLRNTSIAVKGGSIRMGYFGIDKQDIYQLSQSRNSTLYVSEAGVYKLILKSRKPAAYLIKVKLSEMVLPEIMRRGTFSEPQVRESSTV